MSRGFTLGAYYAQRTHCSYGHPWNEENTATCQGHRRCRACDREAARRRRAGLPSNRKPGPPEDWLQELEAIRQAELDAQSS